MKPILSRANRKLLEQIAHANTAVVLDFDGTLVPIVPLAANAVMSGKTSTLLREVAKLYPTAILSGRKRSDVAARVRGTGVQEVVGNHGLEWRGSHRSDRFKKRVALWRRELYHAIRAGEIHAEGLEIEDKKVSLSIHYRMCENRTRAYAEISSFLKCLKGAKVMDGKAVFNVIPDVHVNKGTAVLELRRKFRCEKVIFAGDDVTDEFAFALKPKSFLLDIRVGRSNDSHARYFLRNLGEMDRFLAELIKLRRAV